MHICSTIIGCGAYSLLFGWLSYLGLAGIYIGPIILIGSLALVSFYWLKNPVAIKFWHLPKDNNYHLLFIICFLATNMVLLPILFFHAYNPFNDTFTYLGISDYLQSHAFSQTAQPFPFHAALRGVLTHQRGYKRMGANFFLAFTQSITATSRAYQIYPALITWGLILNILSIFLACRWLIQLPRFYALTIAFCAALLPGPLYFAVGNGFFPQTFGTAYFSYILTITAYLLRQNHTSLKKFMPWLIQIALGLTFIISAYNELFPFVFLVIIASFIAKFITYNNKTLLLKAASIVTLLTLILSNYEIYRMIRSISIELFTTPGNDIKLSLLQFWSVAVGISYNGYHSHNFIVEFIAAVMLVVFIKGIITFIKNHKQRHEHIWFFSILCYFIMFFYFAFLVKNPWHPQSLGQTWSMFKIVNYAFPMVLLGLGLGVYSLSIKKSLVITVLAGLFIVCIPINLWISYRNVTDIKKVSFSNHPFQAYQRLADYLKNQPTQTYPIEIQWENKQLSARLINKQNQTLGYFLYPIPVYFTKHKNSHTKKQPSHLILHYRTTTTPENKILPGGVALQY